ncbi:hypothetical protein FDJ13_gp55 [Gordonia phage Gustav]|uniref:Uncharacterized protein n=1 Tax=Gordonia phage Gustav TaxID=2047872 RepID=A0A2H4PA66_9CAUD|nr:hypothetical protein FDJ13_gp55 [Gordonia phage Gustav]ATW59115.1 hypothetical protein PHIRE_GUSTAV_55 [Gordonia phage Gustav]
MNSPFDTITAATDGQVGYIRDLLERRDISGLLVPSARPPRSAST